MVKYYYVFHFEMEMDSGWFPFIPRVQRELSEHFLAPVQLTRFPILSSLIVEQPKRFSPRAQEIKHIEDVKKYIQEKLISFYGPREVNVIFDFLVSSVDEGKTLKKEPL